MGFAVHRTILAAIRFGVVDRGRPGEATRRRSRRGIATFRPVLEEPILRCIPDGPCPRWLSRQVGQSRSGPGRLTAPPHLLLGTTTWSIRRDANLTVERDASSPWRSGRGYLETDGRRLKPAWVSGRGLEAFRLHYAARVDEGENGEDDVLGERTPGRENAWEAGVSRCQIV